jgi:hypothetical protein
MVQSCHKISGDLLHLTDVTVLTMMEKLTISNQDAGFQIRIDSMRVRMQHFLRIRIQFPI